MRVHTFQVKNIKEGLERIKHELGPSAVIVNTKRVPGQNGAELLEISATIDAPGEPTPTRAGLFRRLTRAPEQQSSDPPVEGSVQPTMSNAQDPAIAHVLNSLQQTVQALTRHVQEVQSEVRHMRLAQELGQQERDGDDGVVPVIPQGASLDDKQAFRLGLTKLWSSAGEEKMLESLYSLDRALRSQGVLEEDVETLLAQVLGEHDGNTSLFALAQRKMASWIQTAPPPWVSRGEGKKEVHIFVGPAGVGKTTLAAKIAAHAQFIASRQVGLVCADTFKIGGRYQLETYAELMELPMACAQDLAALRRGIHSLDDCDCVLVDTTGFNPWVQQSPEASRLSPHVLAMLRDEFDVRLHLVMAANTHTRDLIQWCAQLQDLEIDSMIFTKVDEARHLGALLSVALASNLPISMLGDGRAVPGDVHLPDPFELAEWILRGYRGRVLAETSTYTLED